MAARLPSNRVIHIVVALLIVLLIYFNLPRFNSSEHIGGLLGDINNSTLGFQEIFVVGLPSRTDRRDGMFLQAALSDIRIEFVDGVNGKDIPDKAIPMTFERERMNDASLGSWRAHINAIQEVVRRNLTSALILEDDVDWDVRIKHQLKDFALSARAITQPLPGSKSYADSTFPNPSEGSFTVVPDTSFHSLPSTEPPRLSPYGDNWDLLWIGHCGMHFPFEDNPLIPKGRVIHLEDETVAPKQNLWTFNVPFTLKDKYPEHTRAVHHVQEGVCTLGYAVSQAGARKLLHEVGLKDVTDGFDILLRFFCEGVKGRKYHNCLTTQPALFHHHRAAGPLSASSDIGDHGSGFREKSSTDMVRWSVRLNADVLLEGRTDFVDQYPDNSL
ncbi:glycosyltransferase family 25 protein [Daldinia loculata]|uniref:glycosyltransferase family 25 protein n=1 Tax=Daldinia loculata TaxID=103429 RepID=UPI0020C42830|nr:glycosyltransferase family 25 protein [Daldinia loculata]KAI1651585.1 glycosyltransferase family 25 protein [Daldinia loculata]